MNIDIYWEDDYSFFVLFVLFMLAEIFWSWHNFLHISGGNPSTPKRATGDKQIERLEEDIAILGKISSMADTLLIPHQV